MSKIFHSKQETRHSDVTIHSFFTAHVLMQKSLYFTSCFSSTDCSFKVSTALNKKPFRARDDREVNQPLRDPDSTPSSLNPLPQPTVLLQATARMRHVSSHNLNPFKHFFLSRQKNRLQCDVTRNVTLTLLRLTVKILQLPPFAAVHTPGAFRARE